MYIKVLINFRNPWFAVPRKSTRLYLSLAFVPCDQNWLVNSTTLLGVYSPPITVAMAR